MRCFQLFCFLRQADVVNDVVITSERDGRVNLLYLILSRLVAEVIILFCGRNVRVTHLLHNELLINIGINEGSTISLSNLMHRPGRDPQFFADIAKMLVQSMTPDPLSPFCLEEKLPIGLRVLIILNQASKPPYIW